MDELDLQGNFDHVIHIRVQQRRGTKSITTVQGIPKEFDYKKILKYWKKAFNCNGNIVVSQTDKDEMIIRVSGDQRGDISQFLENQGIALKQNIKIHGA